MTEVSWEPPAVQDPALVGTYPALAKAGGGYVWDAVLEYRVWCRPERGPSDGLEGDDHYVAFASFAAALSFAESSSGTEEPLALVLQEEYIDEPEPGEFVHVRERRIAEWPVRFLRRPRRNQRTIPDFLDPQAPPNRLEILRGLA
jgi:putative acetyltransferase